MTLSDTSRSYDGAANSQDQAPPPRVSARMPGLAARFSRKATLWKALAIVLALLTSITGAEWFVTYCAFSNRCPTVERIAIWPLDKLKSVPLPQLTQVFSR